MSTILALLSIFKINLFGSLISADFWNLKLFGKRKFPKWFLFILIYLIVQIILSVLTREIEDVLFNFRFGLIIILAFSLSTSKFSTQKIGIGLIAIYYLLTPSDVIYYTGIKSVIAITPLLLLPEQLSVRRNIFILIIIPVLALYFSSRALLVGYLLYLIINIYQRRRILILPISLVVLAVFVINFNRLIADNWYSNLVRLNMILEGVKVGSIRTFALGQGYSSWRSGITTAFEEIGINQLGIGTLNPHFIFAEMIIEWGWLGLLIFMFLLMGSFKNSLKSPLGIAIIVACLFTTNTGLERLFLSIGLGKLWQEKK